MVWILKNIQNCFLSSSQNHAKKLVKMGTLANFHNQGNSSQKAQKKLVKVWINIRDHNWIIIPTTESIKKVSIQNIVEGDVHIIHFNSLFWKNSYEKDTNYMYDSTTEGLKN